MTKAWQLLKFHDTPRYGRAFSVIPCFHWKNTKPGRWHYMVQCFCLTYSPSPHFIKKNSKQCVTLAFQSVIVCLLQVASDMITENLLRLYVCYAIPHQTLIDNSHQKRPSSVFEAFIGKQLLGTHFSKCKNRGLVPYNWTITMKNFAVCHSTLATTITSFRPRRTSGCPWTLRKYLS